MNSSIFQNSRAGALRAVLAATLCVSAVGLARADVKITQQVLVTGVPKEAATTPEIGGLPDLNMTVSVYYKGDKVRTENGESIVIQDFAGDKIYTLLPEKKTYYVVPLKQALEAASNNPMLAMLKFDAIADVKDTGETREIAGKPARKYVYTATIKIGLQGNDQVASLFPTITIQGEQWTTEAASISAAALRQQSPALSGNMGGVFAKGLKTLAEKLGTMKGVPLDSTVKTIFKSDNPNSPFAAQLKDPLVKRVQVTALSEDTLPDTLFEVPADYKKIDPPASKAPSLTGG